MKNFRNTAAACGFVVLMTATLVAAVGGQRKADAFPKFAKKENKQCVFCHVNPSGGKRNATGKWYGAHGLSLAGYTPEKAAAEFGGAAGATAPSGVTGTTTKPAPKPSAKPAPKKPGAKPTPKPAPKKK